MLLRLRQGGRRTVVELPDGCRLMRTEYGYPALVIPGQEGDDSEAVVLAPRIRDVAARGLYGLSIVEESTSWY
jgi:hypothetical protein